MILEDAYERRERWQRYHVAYVNVETIKHNTLASYVVADVCVCLLQRSFVSLLKFQYVWRDQEEQMLIYYKFINVVLVCSNNFI